MLKVAKNYQIQSTAFTNIPIYFNIENLIIFSNIIENFPV